MRKQDDEAVRPFDVSDMPVAANFRRHLGANLARRIENAHRDGRGEAYLATLENLARRMFDHRGSPAAGE